MRSLLYKNLKLTIPTILGFLVGGFLLSFPLSFIFDPNAALWPLNSETVRSIEQQRLNDVGRFRVKVALGSAIVGLLIAQTTFIIHNSNESHSRH